MSAKKIYEILPAFADGNSAPAIMMVTASAGIGATFMHSSPRTTLRSSTAVTILGIFGVSMNGYGF